MATIFGWEESIASFQKLGKRTGTDKTTAHSYEALYGKYLHGRRWRGGPQPAARFKMLESIAAATRTIVFRSCAETVHRAPSRRPSRDPHATLGAVGLGCTMWYGAGKSVQLWHEWFGPGLELHELEFDRTCVRKWRHSYPNITMHVGDQASSADLARLLVNARVTPPSHPVADDGGGLFDLIVDDGSHRTGDVIASYSYLFPRALKPGGRGAHTAPPCTILRRRATARALVVVGFWLTL